MKVYIGSTNRNKVQAAEEVLKPYGHEVIGMEVDSQVGAQPMCDLDTITGAKNRAKALPKDGLRIGLEAGIEFLDDIMYLTNFGVLIDLNNKKVDTKFIFIRKWLSVLYLTIYLFSFFIRLTSFII